MNSGVTFGRLLPTGAGSLIEDAGRHIERSWR